MINKDVLNNYKSIDWNKLLRKDMGSYSLEDTKPNLDRIKRMFDNILNYSKINNLYNNLIYTIEDQLNSFTSFSNEIIHNFQATSEKQDWIDRIKETEYNTFTSLRDIINYIEEDSDSKSKEIKEEYQNKIKELNEELGKAKKLLEGTQNLEVKKQTQEYGNFFGIQADKNKKSARNNFQVMIGSVFLTIIFAWMFLQIDFVKDEGKGFWDNLLTAINTQNILMKFVILSLGGYLISHFAKSYLAEKHLYNLNIQRQNALNSHKQILDSIIATESENEKEIRNAILLELTKAIFENKNTGYVKSSEKSSFNISPNIKV